MLSTSKITFQSGRRAVSLPTSICCPGLRWNASMTTAATIKDIRVEIAAPATPRSNTNIKTAFPTTFRPLEAADTTMGSRVLPAAGRGRSLR